MSIQFRHELQTEVLALLNCSYNTYYRSQNSNDTDTAVFGLIFLYPGTGKFVYTFHYFVPAISSLSAVKASNCFVLFKTTNIDSNLQSMVNPNIVGGLLWFLSVTILC